MKQADAKSVRGSMAESIRFRLFQLTDHTHQTSPVHMWQGTSSKMSSSSWARFIQSERILRRIIPTLIFLLLVMVAWARISSLSGMAEDIERNAKTELGLTSQLAVLSLADTPSLEEGLKSPTLAEVFLESSLPDLGEKEGRIAFLVSATGKVVAQTPSAPDLTGVTLDRLSGGDDLITILGDKAGIRDIKLDGAHNALAISRSVWPNAEQKGPSILLVQTEAALYHQWNQSVRSNLVLFIAISSVLMIVLYAYFALGKTARNADKMFRETHARFDTALSRGHCGLWDWDLSRGRVVWSRSMYQMLGMEPTVEVMGFGELTELMHPDDQDLITLANSAFGSSQRQIDHRVRMLHSSGSWVWMRIRAELVSYKGSEPHLIGIAVDITEQEALKQRSRDADIRLREAIENISEAFVLWDAKKRLVMCNSKYQQFMNLPASAVVAGAHYDDVMEKSRKPKVRSQISPETYLENGTKMSEAQVEDGRWLQISQRRTQGGGFVSVGTDITQIKRNEEKLQDSERRLMATVTDLTATQRKLELQAQQLVEFADNLSEEKQRADAGNKAKSEFLANISHELRTPLNAIIGFSDIMRSRMFGPLGSQKYDEYADDIHHSGSFLLGVINDVLDMSKIEAGRFELSPEPMNLHELLDDTLRIIKVQAEDAGISVGQKIPENLEMEADRRAVKQILLNLLSNAVKFTPAGGKIDVTAKVLKSSVNILIEDNGIGISEEALERLGQPFEQVQDQFTKNHKGSGLGLAIARSLSILHGGTLKIRSIPGKGTTVAIRLPLKRNDELQETEDERAA